jgi:alkylation response protein AidB-like acyl-CoA dehydrogenase
MMPMTVVEPAPPIAEAEALSPGAGLPTAEDRSMMRDAVRGVLQQVWPASAYEHGVTDPDKQRAVWRALVDLGVATLGKDPSEGGVREIVLVAEELGRAASLAPILATAIANLLLAPRAAEARVGALLQQIHTGQAIVALSFGDCDCGRAVGKVSVSGGRAHGTVQFIEAADIATHLLAFVAGGPCLAIVALTSDTSTIRATRAMGADGLAQITLDGAAVELMPLKASDVLAMLNVSRLALAARTYGGARHVFDLAVDYAKERKQFGRHIGSFQALQHKLVNNLMALEGVRQSVDYAAECYDFGHPQWRLYAAAAFASAGATLRQVALEHHHAFGAIGYAEEHVAPRYFKRAHVDLVRHGGYQAARADLADFYLDETPRRVPELDLGPSGNAFREEVRQWLEQTWPKSRAQAFYDRPYVEREYDPDFARQLGAMGWIGLNWPKRFGGQERRPLELIGFIEVLEQYQAPRAGAPIHGNMLIMRGTPQQQAERLPAILRGEAIYGMGLSEPNAGSDLASLKTRAERDGDDWVINGQKIWCTTFYGDYLLVAARTDPDAEPQHAGISAFIVPTDAPGLTIKPTGAMYDGQFANLFFDDVRVPARDMIGPVNGGWEVITSALITERGYYGGQMVCQLVHQFEALCDVLRTAVDAEGMPLRLQPLVRDKIGDLIAQIEIGRRMMLSCARSAENGVTPIQDAAMSKVYSGELMERFGQAALDILGLEAALSFGAPGAMLRGQLEQKLRYSLMWVISLGTNEIQRSIIARSALNLPSK